MGDNRTLLLGIDIGDEYTQISNYHYKLQEPESVSLNTDKEDYFIPTCLAIKESNKEWLIGQDALRCGEREQGILVEGLLQKLQNEESVVIYGTEFSAAALLERYLKRVLGSLRQIYLNNSILKLVITTRKVNRKIKSQILEALGNLGITEERVLVQSYIQSFMYYVVSQRQELWVNDVGLFDYSEEGLKYYQLSIGRKSSTVPVIVRKYDLPEPFPYEFVKQEESERLSNHFEETAKQILYKKIVSTIYVTGKGFEGTWSDPALRNLCSGRRVFRGQNLYTKGACYAAYAEAMGCYSDYVFLDEERITSEISIQVYQDAKEQEILLAKAGVPWWQAEKSLMVILDHTDEIHFVVKSISQKEPVLEVMKLENLRKRENKTLRMSINLKFIDRDTAVVTVRDTGFGTFYENSHRIWEQILKL